MSSSVFGPHIQVSGHPVNKFGLTPILFLATGTALAGLFVLGIGAFSKLDAREPTATQTPVAEADKEAFFVTFNRAAPNFPQWSPDGIIKATALQSLGTAAPGKEKFQTQESLPSAWAVPHSEAMRPAERFICMKPRSIVILSIPKGATAFEASLYSRLSNTGQFSIAAAKGKGNVPPQANSTDWESLKSSPTIQYGRLFAELDPAQRFLKLTVDAKPDGIDQMYWVNPEFVTKTKSIPATEKMLTSEPTGFPQYFSFGVQHSVPFVQPLETDGKTMCSEMLHGNAPAEITLPIPPGSKRFTALVGCLEDYKDVEVSINVDNVAKPLFYTEGPNWDQVDIELPAQARSITLSAGPMKNNRADRVGWLYPRFHNATLSEKEKNKLAADWKRIAAGGRSAMDPHVRISSWAYSPDVIPLLTKTIPGLRGWNGICVVPQLNGHANSLMIHPDAPDVPATMSFGQITSQCKGKLRIWTRNFPTHGDGDIAHRTVVKRNGEIVQDFQCPFDKGWQELVIPFDHQYVTLEHWPVGWYGEHGVYDYEISFGK